MAGFGRYALLISSALLISYVSSRPALVRYFDATANKNQTLSPNAQKIMAEIGDAPLEVVSYINILDQRYWRGQPAQRNADKDRWEPYLRFKPDIKFSYVYYYDSVPDPEIYKRSGGKSLRQMAEDYAKAFKVDFSVFKGPEEIKKIVDLEPEQNRYVMQLKFKGKSTFLRLFDDNEAFPSEAETSAALERLIVKLPKIVFLQGQQERDPKGYDPRSLRTLTSNITFRNSLVNQGFDVETLSLKDQNIPRDISALVIADPETDFEPEVLEKIRKYIADGGNLMITGEPGKKAIIAPLIQPMGVEMLDGTIVQPAKNHSPDLALTYMTPAAAGLSKLVRNAYEDSLTIAMQGVTGFSYTQGGMYRIGPLLMTDPSRSWMAADTSKSGPAIPTALSLVRNINGHEQRIVITGDADFLKILNLRSQHIDVANYIFDTSLFGWLSNGKFPIDTTLPNSKDDHFNIGESGVLVLKYVVLGVLPALLLMFCVVLLKRRKKK
jgi:ABC-2 type transport system permease protein